MKSIVGLLIITSVILGVGCSTADKQNDNSYIVNDKDIIADTIYYPVRIKNISTEDEWATKRLANLNRPKLVEDIFNAIYSNKAQAYNYLTNAPIDAASIREQENDGLIKRDDVIELEFRETWWYNADKSVFKKEVHSVLVAGALYDSNGEFRGMKALFYVKMK